MPGNAECERQSQWVAAGLTFVLFALAYVLVWPLDPDLLAASRVESVSWHDRAGRPLGEQVGPLGSRAQFVSLEELGAYVAPALLAAEDKRFFSHFGLDPAAILRACWQNVGALSVVSGGSTLTQQLARVLRSEEAVLAGKPLPGRTLREKLHEARLALRLERTFEKQEILTAFLNRAPFGNGALGVGAAAERLFGVTPSSLSLAQAAYLAALPKGPSAFAQRPDAALRRQHHILSRLWVQGIITQGQLERARNEELRLARPNPARPDSLYAIAWARQTLAEANVPIHGEITLTVDSALESEVSRIFAEQIPSVYARGGKSAAAVVESNATGEILAMVGAAFADNPRWGQFNAATAIRQPGSALKPFLYSAALSRGFTAASLAADIDRPFPDTWGVYMPENYDQRFHGPVRFRESLAQSLNVSAVDVLFRTGLDHVFNLLDDLGLKTLDRRPSYFGLGLALGSGGVRLLDLTNAYATLARGGVKRPVRIVRQAGRAPLSESLAIPGAEERVLDERVAYIISSILSDAGARTPQFGPRSVLSTPYWTAVKTGTSKGFRDNWTIGFTPEVTVGVWVGDPSGEPMRGVSGVEGAGIVWRKIMNHVSGYRSTAPAEPPGLVHARICATSGELLGPTCPGGRDELFIAGTEPKRECSFHRRALVDPENGLLVPEHCHLPGAELRAVTVYPSLFAAWALEQEAGISDRQTPRCPPPPGPHKQAEVRLLSPAPTEALRIDHDAPRDRQALLLMAEAGEGTGPITFLVDGQPFRTVETPYQAYWPLSPGEHRIQARVGSDGPTSDEHLVIVH